MAVKRKQRKRRKSGEEKGGQKIRREKTFERRRQSRFPAPGKGEKTAETPRSAMKRMEYLKQLLLKKRNDVVQGLEAQLGRKLSREFGQKIDSAMDSADMSSQDVDQGIDYSLLEMKYVQYKEIADAFRKLQSGAYGLCEECGQEIDLKRLEVSPPGPVLHPLQNEQGRAGEDTERRDEIQGISAKSQLNFNSQTANSKRFCSFEPGGWLLLEICCFGFGICLTPLLFLDKKSGIQYLTGVENHGAV